MAIGVQAASTASQPLRMLVASSHNSRMLASDSATQKLALSSSKPAPLHALLGLSGRALKQASPSSLAQSPPPPRMSPEPESNTSLHAVSQTSSNNNTVFLKAFFAAISANLSTYASAQCAEGYSGRLCTACSQGYGSQGVAVCKPCSRLNTLYYALATLLTLCFFAWTFHSSLSYVRRSTPLHEQALESKRKNRSSPSVFPNSRVCLGLNPLSTPVPASKKHGSATLAGLEPNSAWQDSGVSPSNPAIIAPGLQWGMLPTPFALSGNIGTAAHTNLLADSSSTVSNPQLQEDSPHPLTLLSSHHSITVTVSQPGLQQLGEKGSLVRIGDAGYQALHIDGLPIDYQSPLYASEALHISTSQPANLSGASTSSALRVSFSDALTSFPSSRDQLVIPWASGSRPAAEYEEITSEVQIAGPSLSAACSNPSGLETSSSDQQSSRILQQSLGTDSDVQQTDESEQDPLNVWLDKASPTVIAHIRRRPQPCDETEQDSDSESETQTSYFADTRDPVVVDSNRAAMVVTRIFLSYLQVRLQGQRYDQGYF